MTCCIKRVSDARKESEGEGSLTTAFKCQMTGASNQKWEHGAFAYGVRMLRCGYLLYSKVYPKKQEVSQAAVTFGNPI
jgi:hypothetical protein